MKYPSETEIRTLLTRHARQALPGWELSAFEAMPRHGFVSLEAVYVSDSQQMTLSMYIAQAMYDAPAPTYSPGQWTILAVRFRDIRSSGPAHTGYDGMDEIMRKYPDYYLAFVDNDVVVYTDLQVLAAYDGVGRLADPPVWSEIQAHVSHDRELLRAAVLLTYSI